LDVLEFLCHFRDILLDENTAKKGSVEDRQIALLLALVLQEEGCSLCLDVLEFLCQFRDIFLDENTAKKRSVEDRQIALLLALVLQEVMGENIKVITYVETVLSYKSRERTLAKK
jgi:hypothetical protein